MSRSRVFVLLVLPVACARSDREEAPPSKRSPLPVKSNEVGARPALDPPRRGVASGSLRSGLTSASAVANCEKICSRSRELGCVRAADCMEGCLEMASIEPCIASFEKLYSCLAGEPVAHWECAEDGIGAIREGYCEREQAAAAGCVEAQTSK